MLKNKFTEIETIIEITKITSITSFPPSLQLSIKLLVALCARGKMEKFDFLLNYNFANYNAYIQRAKLLPETTVMVKIMEKCSDNMYILMDTIKVDGFAMFFPCLEYCHFRSILKDWPFFSITS